MKLSEWVFFRRLGKCFKKIKQEHVELGFYRFYLATKCPDLLPVNDAGLLAFLFYLHHLTVDFDDHIVIYYLRSLRA